jgi:hypothetical protein
MHAERGESMKVGLRQTNRPDHGRENEDNRYQSLHMTPQRCAAVPVGPAPVMLPWCSIAVNHHAYLLDREVTTKAAGRGSLSWREAHAGTPAPVVCVIARTLDRCLQLRIEYSPGRAANRTSGAAVTGRVVVRVDLSESEAGQGGVG